MSKHTPGLWEVRKRTYVYRGSTYLCSMASPRSVDQTRLDGESWLDMQHRIQPELDAIEDERRANACLVAAAPDLLEALREVLAAERAGSRVPDTVYGAEKQLDRIRAAVDKAEAAIAKANGDEA